MINMFKIVTLVPIFIMVLVIAFNALQSALGFTQMHSFIPAVCVSMLSVIGIVRYLKDSAEMLLLPYAVLVVATPLLWLFSFLDRSFRGSKDRVSNSIDEKNITEMHKKNDYRKQ